MNQTNPSTSLVWLSFLLACPPTHASCILVQRPAICPFLPHIPTVRVQEIRHSNCLNFHRLSFQPARDRLALWMFDQRRLIRFSLPSTANREHWRGATGLFLPLSASRHVSCGCVTLLVEDWVVLDRPPNPPLLRKEEAFTSSYTKAEGSKEVFRSEPSARTGRFNSVIQINYPPGEAGITGEAV